MGQENGTYNGYASGHAAIRSRVADGLASPASAVKAILQERDELRATLVTYLKAQDELGMADGEYEEAYERHNDLSELGESTEESNDELEAAEAALLAAQAVELEARKAVTELLARVKEGTQ